MSSLPPRETKVPAQATVPQPPRTPEGAERRPDEPPWQIWTAPAAVVLGLALGVLASIVVSIAAQASGSSLTHPTPVVTIISSFLFDLAFVGAALYLSALHTRPRAADFGFRRARPPLAIKAFLLAGVGYYVVTAIYASLFKLHGSDKLPSEFGVSKSTAALVAAAVFVCVIAPIAEELFFRGFFFGALRRLRIVIAGHDIGTWVAAVVTGIVFGIAHTGSASPEYLLPLGFLGFVLCLVRWRTGSLYPCMALHALNNSLALGINQLHWGAGGIVGLIVASALAIAGITAPLAARAPALA